MANRRTKNKLQGDTLSLCQYQLRMLSALMKLLRMCIANSKRLIDSISISYCHQQIIEILSAQPTNPFAVELMMMFTQTQVKLGVIVTST